MLIIEDIHRRYVGKRVKAANVIGRLDNIECDLRSGQFYAIIKDQNDIDRKLPLDIVELINDVLPLPG